VPTDAYPRPRLAPKLPCMRRAALPILVLATGLGLSGCTTDDPSTDDDTASQGGSETTSGPAEQVFAACEGEFPTEDPNPAYAWTPNAIELVSQELAPGVFVVYDVNAPDGPSGRPLATSAGFVIGEDGVVLVETMINRRLLCQLVDLVRAETDLPITHAINTSFHGDHSYGNAFLPEEVEVVQHERTAAYIAANFEADREFMESNFGADQGLDEVMAVLPDIAVTDEGWSIDLGSVTVEARYYGFGQTEGDLFVWVPEAKVLWTGNALVNEAPALPWLLDGHAHEVEATLALVRAELPAGATVVPGHGPPLTPEAFVWGLDYLAALQDGVAASVEQGLTLEETVAAVTLEEFRGYALFDWIHSAVNVPNTYAEQ
jgi:cyclase